MSAILREEPPDLSATNKNVQPGLERIVRHCLEKNPEERFYSARDVAFDLRGAVRTLRAAGRSARRDRHRRAPPRPARGRWRGLLGARRGAPPRSSRPQRPSSRPPPSFQQLTFRRGQIFGARSRRTARRSCTRRHGTEAAWRSSSADPRAPSRGRSASPARRSWRSRRSGEMAVSLNRASRAGFRRDGHARSARRAGGGAPREILKGVEFADLAPDGKNLAIVRVVPGKIASSTRSARFSTRRAGGSATRVLADGERIAFDRSSDAGRRRRLARRRRPGRQEALSRPFATARGSGGHPSGEVWFTAVEVGGNRRSLHDARRNGRDRASGSRAR